MKRKILICITALFTIVTLSAFVIHDRRCNRCQGTGKIQEYCAYCKGHGEKYCNYCGGRGSRNCGFCSGTGILRCNGCNGRGTIKNNTEYCQKCGGHGEVYCQNCSGSGQINCGRCDRGVVPCYSCNRTGIHEWKCPDCRGTGIIRSR